MLSIEYWNLLGYKFAYLITCMRQFSFGSVLLWGAFVLSAMQILLIASSYFYGTEYEIGTALLWLILIFFTYGIITYLFWFLALIAKKDYHVRIKKNNVVLFMLPILVSVATYFIINYFYDYMSIGDRHLYALISGIFILFIEVIICGIKYSPVTIQVKSFESIQFEFINNILSYNLFDETLAAVNFDKRDLKKYFLKQEEDCGQWIQRIYGDSNGEICIVYCDILIRKKLYTIASALLILFLLYTPVANYVVNVLIKFVM